MEFPTKCPKCGKEVRSISCAHCGRRMSAVQSELLQAAYQHLTAAGGNPGVSTRFGIGSHRGSEDGGSSDTPTSLNHERYSPPALIALVRQAMGEIDLDPASSRRANKTVKAKAIFTREKDGLSQPWQGRVFLNPPFDDWPTWVAKLDDEIGAKRVSQAVLVGPANISAFRPLLERDGLLCLLDSRPKFYDPGAGEYIDPPFGSLLCYVGSGRDRFLRVFRKHGIVLEQAT